MIKNENKNNLSQSANGESNKMKIKSPVKADKMSPVKGSPVIHSSLQQIQAYSSDDSSSEKMDEDDLVKVAKERQERKKENRKRKFNISQGSFWGLGKVKFYFSVKGVGVDISASSIIFFDASIL
jgi:hypothetical protein